MSSYTVISPNYAQFVLTILCCTPGPIISVRVSALILVNLINNDVSQHKPRAKLHTGLINRVNATNHVIDLDCHAMEDAPGSKREKVSR